MSLQIPAGSLVISFGEEEAGQSGDLIPNLRLDLWPTWLEIGCEHAGRAADTGSRNCALTYRTR